MPMACFPDQKAKRYYQTDKATARISNHDGCDHQERARAETQFANGSAATKQHSDRDGNHRHKVERHIIRVAKDATASSAYTVTFNGQ